MNDLDRTKAAILDRIDIVDVISEHAALKRRGNRLVALCPFHSEKTPSFHVSPEKGMFNCFGCGAGGDVFSFLMKRENIGFMEALRLLADRAGVPLVFSRGAEAGPGIDRSAIAKLNDWAVKFFRQRLLAADDAGRSARAYLSDRGISDETSERFGLGVVVDGGPSVVEAAGRAGFGRDLLIEADLLRRGEEGRFYETFRNRLMFPIRDATRRVIGFGGRTLVDDRAKYINTRQNALFDKGNNLYGIDLARTRISEGKPAILVEGYMDCIALHQAGFCEAVATLGTALTEQQVGLLRRYCEQVVLLFDSDSAGDAAADRAIRIALPRHLSVRLARISGEKDPADFLRSHPPEAFSDVLNGAQDALEFRWSQTRRRFEGDASDARRSEAVVDFVSLVAEAFSSGAVDAIQRGLIANRVAHLLSIEPREVHLLMRRAEKKGNTRTVAGQSEAAVATVRGPADPEQAAWRTVLEVLVSEPGLCRDAGPLPDLERIADARDRRIAGRIVSLSETLGDFGPMDLLACCQDAEDAQRVSELEQAGKARGNYRATLELAWARIRDVIGAGRMAEARNERSLEKTQEHLIARKHFVPSRSVNRGISPAPQ